MEARAKSIVFTPLFLAIYVASEATPAEWELGIPPVSKNKRQSHFPPVIFLIGIFKNCAIPIVASAVIIGLFIKPPPI